MIPFLVFAWINTAAGRFVLGHYNNLDMVGIYSLAAQFSGILLLFATAFDNALIPHFYRLGRLSSGSVDLGRLVLRYVVFFAMLSLLISAIAPTIIIAVSAPEYYGAVAYVGPLILAVWLFVLTKPITWSLTHSEKTTTLAKIHGVAAGTMVALLFVLIGWLQLGINGAVIAAVLTNLVTIVVGGVYSQRAFRLHFDAREVVLSAMVLLASFIGFQLLPPSHQGLFEILMRLGILLVAGTVMFTILSRNLPASLKKSKHDV